MINKKYKLTLLKDLPNHEAGTEVLNITEDELLGKKDYYGSFFEIYDLRNDPKWVKIDEDTRCDCLTKPYIPIFCTENCKGKLRDIRLDFNKKEIRTINDDGYLVNSPIKIKYCPFCGRLLED